MGPCDKRRAMCFKKTLVDSSLLGCLLCRNRKPRLGRCVVEKTLGQVFSQRRAVLKAMPRATSRDPHIIKVRMSVDQKVTVPCVFILAHARFQNCSIR